MKDLNKDKKFLNKTKNGLISFWANAKTMKKHREPYKYKTEYQELGIDYVDIKRYCEYHNLDYWAVCSAVGRGKIPIKKSRGKIYINKNFHYIGGQLKYLDVLDKIEDVFTEVRCFTEASKILKINATTVRRYMNVFMQDNPNITLKKRRNNIKYSNKDVEVFKEAYEKTGTFKATAEKLGIKATTLRYIIQNR